MKTEILSINYCASIPNHIIPTACLTDIRGMFIRSHAFITRATTLGSVMNEEQETTALLKTNFIIHQSLSCTTFESIKD